MNQSKLDFISIAVVQERVDHEGRIQDCLHPMDVRQIVHYFILYPAQSDLC